ncbi:MAG: hypothetical protein MSG64_07580 [Pyrinomonadaceae bacterium MAG19_C2-C3]|nr:hypothetical protein [Pyrinomonadaceae bacterium MAG19_C2-C3]
MSLVIHKARQYPNRIVFVVQQQSSSAPDAPSQAEDEKLSEFIFSPAPDGVDAATHIANCRREVKLLMQAWENENSTADDIGTALSIEGETL